MYMKSILKCNFNLSKLIQIWLLFIYYQSKIINNINYYYKYTNDIY